MSDIAARESLVKPDLTLSEQQELADCEAVVGYGIEMFLAACRALKTIRDKHLYRGDYRSWQSYVTARWSSLFTDSGTADRWINVAVVNENLTPVGVTIEHDRHARELVKYNGAIQQAVALVGVRAAALEGGKPVTESHFKHAGAVLAEMITTGTVDIDDAMQHPVTELLAVSVVSRRRESVLERLKLPEPVLVETVTAALAGWDARQQAHTSSVFVASVRLGKGKRYTVKIYEVKEESK